MKFTLFAFISLMSVASFAEKKELVCTDGVQIRNIAVIETTECKINFLLEGRTHINTLFCRHEGKYHAWNTQTTVSYQPNSLRTFAERVYNAPTRFENVEDLDTEKVIADVNCYLRAPLP